MSKRKHHYVPRFYLHAFQSAPRQIHLYNIARKKYILNVSLRDQCYQHKFYGSDDQLENNLAILDGAIAPALQGIRNNERVPPQGSDTHDLLLLFVALQSLRTTVAAARVNASIDKLAKQVFFNDPRLDGVDLDAVTVGYQDPVREALLNLDVLISCIDDLGTHLVVSREGQFITSDNPVFRYNQYCEGIRTSGTIGGLSRGLQIFVPLSPSHLVVLYDRKVYKFGSRSAKVNIASQRDMEYLNLMQLTGAAENVYFSGDHQIKLIDTIAHKVSRFRKEDSAQIREFLAEDRDDRSLVHLFEKAPNINLDLSFASIQRNARRVPLFERTRPFRKELPLEEPSIPPSWAGGTMRFTRPKKAKIRSN